jgi:bifunctional non-homologous end joining protein LigD
LILDGEIVVHGDDGLPSFQRLQQRARLSRASDVRLQAVEHPATLYLFDAIGFEDFDLRSLPLLERKDVLRRVLPPLGPLKFADHIEEQGEAFYRQVEQLGLEGIVAKRADAPYRGRRTADWIKVRADRTDDFVVVGYSRPKGRRGGFGALHLAAYRDRELVYIGRVGSGFTEEQLDEVGSLLEAARRDEPACARAPRGRDHVWVEPGIVCEVRYKEWTEEELLRQPVFLRFRTDKDARECRHPGVRTDEAERDDLAMPQVEHRVERTVHFSNLDKVFWPEEGYTKGDLIEYYRAITPWIMPYLRDRPVVMTRFPDGIHGKSFFQKDAPGFAPEWIRRETMWSDDTERALNYFVVDSPEALLYIANLASIPLHVWASRVATLEQPDWCVLDLDPKEAPFTDVIAVAQCVRAVCEDVALPVFIKTSGQSGLHVMVPLGRQCTHEQAKTLGELLARVVVTEAPDLATITRLPAQREGKVYVDYLQNGRGKLIVAPFCVRPYAGAKVSMPLEWSEVNERLDPLNFTVATAIDRMTRLGGDPLLPVLEHRPDLNALLARIGRRLAT